MWLRRGLKRTADDASPEPPPKRVLLRRHTPVVEPSIAFSMTGGDFQRGGSALQKFAGNAVAKAIKAVGRPHGGRAIKVASFCTGSAADAIALDSLQHALKAEDMDITFEHSFYCEKHDRKRDVWCKKVHKIISGTDIANLLPCAFTDCEVLGTSKATCTMHKKQSPVCNCTIPDWLSMLVAGFSCKDLSRANQNKGALQGADLWNALQTPGGSAQTMHAVVNLVKATQIDALVLENSDELAGTIHSAALDEFLNALDEQGFDCHAYVMNSSDYALPQERKRCYIIGVRRPNKTFALREGNVAFFEKVKSLLKQFATPGPCVVNCLLPNDDPNVLNLLEHREFNASHKGCKRWDSKTIATHHDRWMKVGGQRLGGMGVSSADMSSAWYKTLPAREKDLLAFHQFKTQGEDKLSKARRQATDLHQSVDQFTWAALTEDEHVHLPTILPASKMWVSHRLITGAESLSFQGWPIFDERFKDLLENESNAAQQDLAGNAFPTTCILACVLAILFAADIDIKQDDEEDERTSSSATAIQQAMLLLKQAN